MAWCFEDEGNSFTDSILAQMPISKAIVPTIWPLEVANVLLQAQRKKRLSSLEASSFIDALSVFSITIDSSTSQRALHTISTLAVKTELTVYDASYLELALREKLPLMTLDKAIIKAANQIGIKVKHEI